MSLFFRYILKNICENKGRLFLLLFSITISTALLIGSIGAVDILKNVMETSKKSTAEGKDFAVISSTSEAFFNVEDLDTEGIQNIEGQLRFISSYSKDGSLSYAIINGRTQEQIKVKNVLEGSCDNLTGSQCIISQRVSEEKKLKLGDNFSVYVNGMEIKLSVAAISANRDKFYLDKTSQFEVIASYEYLADLFDVSGKVNYVLVNATSGNIINTIKAYNDAHQDFKAVQLYNVDTLIEQMGEISSVLYVMLSIVVLISILIIYDAFKLTVSERIPIIGTFLSQGASYAKVEGILLFESAIYGAIAGVLGSIIGALILFLINYFMSPLAAYGIHEPFKMNPLYILIGLVFSVCLSFISALLPVRKIRKYSEKDIILNKITYTKKKRVGSFVAGVICLCIGFVYAFNDSEWVVSTSIAGTIIAIVGIVLVYKTIVDWLSGLLHKLLKDKHAILGMAFNNVRSNGVLKDGMLLIIIALLCSILISSAAASFGSEIKELYYDMNYDLSVTNIPSTMTNESNSELIMQKLKAIEGVDPDSVGPYTYTTAFVGETKIIVDGVYPKEFGEMTTYLDLLGEKNKKVYQKFCDSDSKEIIISDRLLRDLKAKVGDTVTITINDREDTYKIIGSINGRSFNGGAFILMNYDKLRASYNVNEAYSISFRVTDKISDVKTRVESMLSKHGATCILKEDDQASNMNMVDSIANIMDVFTVMAVAVAAVGVFNNMTIVFLQRKREFAVLSSVGMTTSKRAYLLLVESIIVALGSCMVAFAFAPLIVKIFEKILVSIAMAMALHVESQRYLVCMIATIVICMIATLPIVSRNKKISIVEELKYE